MSEQPDRDQRTENATPQRIRKAREEGQIGMSSELLGSLVLCTGVLIFWIYGQRFFGTIAKLITSRVSYNGDTIEDPRGLVGALIADVQTVGIACLAFILPIVLVASLGGVLQTNFNFSMKPLQSNWGKLSVKSGIGRIFSSKSLVRGALAIVKASIIGIVVYFTMRREMDKLAGFAAYTFKQLMLVMCGMLLVASIVISASMLIVGAIDLAYQKWKHLQDLKMSLQNVKDENKETDGDPMIKARIKRLQQELGRKRMLADVPEATVVITNPTHFAVAIRYDRETMAAPVVVAKGADNLARRIIEIAKENDVAVVERKPVARFLYANVEIGNPIPFELYQAVAEVLNFVNKIRSGV